MEGILYLLSFYLGTSWLTKQEERPPLSSLREDCHLNFSKASNPAAGFSCCTPCRRFKGCRQSGVLSPDPSGPLPLSSVIVNGRCMCSRTRRCLTPGALEMFLEKALFACSLSKPSSSCSKEQPFALSITAVQRERGNILLLKIAGTLIPLPSIIPPCL